MSCARIGLSTGSRPSLDGARPGCIMRGDAGGGETSMNGSSVNGAAGRRAFLAGVTTACVVPATRAFGQAATPSPPPPEGDKQYRTAGALVADLANRRVSAVELLDQ